MKFYKFELLSALFLATEEVMTEDYLIAELGKNGAAFSLIKLHGYFVEGKLKPGGKFNFPDKIPKGYHHLVGKDPENMVYKDKDGELLTGGILARRFDKMILDEREEYFIGKTWVEKYLIVKKVRFIDLVSSYFIFEGKLWHVVAPAHDRSKGFAESTSIEGHGIWPFEANQEVLEVVEGKVHEIKKYTDEKHIDNYNFFTNVFRKLQGRCDLTEFPIEKLPTFYRLDRLPNGEAFFVPIKLNEKPKKSDCMKVDIKDFIDPFTKKKLDLRVTVKGVIAHLPTIKPLSFPYWYPEKRRKIIYVVNPPESV